ncbi:MAG TPA: helix-turn-helix domain-containing protein [Gemmatimonadaceae bacterium]|jgi:AcrR family transcriptional regulator
MILADQGKGAATRARIIDRSARLFNAHGYAATAISEVVEAAEIQTGGLYRHFRDKDALALAAFDHATTLHADLYQRAVDSATGAVNKLSALAGAMASIVEHPIIDGGCPLLNAAVETDDGGTAQRALRTRVRRSMRGMIDFVTQIIADGIAAKQLRRDVHAADEAAALIALMEGSIMLSKLYDDPSFVLSAAHRATMRAQQLAATTSTTHRAAK